MQPVTGATSPLRSQAFLALHEITVAIAGVLDPDVLAKLVVQRARSLLGADAAALYFWDKESSSLRLQYGNDDHVDSKGPMVGSGRGTSRHAFDTCASVVVRDYASLNATQRGAREVGLQAVMAVPLVVNQQAVGSLVVRGARTKWSTSACAEA